MDVRGKNDYDSLETEYRQQKKDSNIENWTYVMNWAITVDLEFACSRSKLS